MPRPIAWFFIAAFVAATAGCSCAKKPPVTGSGGMIGDPCTGDGDCESGLCFALKGEGQKCGNKCSSGCDPMHEVCTQLGFNRYGCVPARAGLCAACVTNSDCPYAADSCILVGGIKVCGQDCSYDGNCPDGYRCGPATDYTNNQVPAQCQPKSATCDCTPQTVGQRLMCQKSNDAGTCVGVRVVATSMGYTPCTAQDPTPEGLRRHRQQLQQPG